MVTNLHFRYACVLLLSAALLLSTAAAANTLPDVLLRDGAGTRAHLSDWHGQYVLLNIWATWCPPCVREMPGLLRLQQSMAEKPGNNLVVLPVSVEAGKAERVTEFYQRHDLTGLPLYLLDDKADMVALKVLGLPTTMLLDPQGKIVWRIAGDLDWDDGELREKLNKDLADIKLE